MLGYYFRTANFEFKKLEDNRNIIVFTHGILSHALSAFKLDSQDGYLWNLIENACDVSKFDIGLFSYGKIDIAYLLEGDWPINNLLRLSHELHGYIGGYKNVFLVGHSQGGLLAKTYASQFAKKQGIHLLTLHTPHRNKSFSVMRFNDREIWDGTSCFYVPHIFCASINDNIIVKPDNALDSCYDKRYLSKDTTKHRLGHSHLSSSPDNSLLNLYRLDIHNFIRSGLSREVIDTSDGTKGNPDSDKIIRVLYSRYKDRIEELSASLNPSQIIIQPWLNISKLSLHAYKPVPGCTVLHVGSSVNYFVRHINLHYENNIKLEIKDLDTAHPSSLKLANDSLCQRTFEQRYNEKNPYKHIPCDIRDFTKNSLIKCDQFFKIFSNMLFDSKTEMLERAFNTEYKKHLSRVYKKAAKQWRRLVIQDIASCFSSIQITPAVLEALLSTLVKEIRGIRSGVKTQGKWISYLDVYSLVKKIFHDGGYNIDIFDVEVIVSKLFESEGTFYRLDKFYKILFSDADISSPIA